MKQLEGCPCLGVRAQLHPDVGKPREKALVSTPGLPAGAGLEGAGEVGWVEVVAVEVGARPALLPGLISSGFFQNWPAQGGEAGTESLFPSNGSRVSFPGPSPPCSGQPSIHPCPSQCLLLMWAEAKAEAQVPGDCVWIPRPYLRWFLSLK